MIEAVALDIDGTVTDRHDRISDAVRQGLLDLMRLVPVVFITGRTGVDAMKFLADRFIDNPDVIGENGGPAGSRQVWERLTEDEARMLWMSRRTRYTAWRFPMLHHPGEWAVEACPMGIDKGHALSDWAHGRGFEPNNIVAVGDNMPDILMLATAGFGVAMGHAPDELKRYAEFVAPPVEEDGLAVAISDFILPMVGAVRP